MIAYFGHHKCASTWITSILREIALTANIRAEIGQLYLFRKAELERIQTDFYFSLNTSYSSLKALNFKKAFHVIRDPRDIIVSGYYSHLKTHETKNWPGLKKHREVLQSCNKDDGLFLEIDFSDHLIRPIFEWDYQTNDRVLEVKMEELTSNPIHEFRNILEFLDVLNVDGDILPWRLRRSFSRIEKFLGTKLHKGKVSEQILKDVLSHYSFKKLSGGRKVGQVNENSHYRKGVAGDWKNHFKQEHLDYFNSKFGREIENLGYDYIDNLTSFGSK